MEKRIYRLTLLTEMLGTTPKDPEIYKTFIESKKPVSLNGEEEYLTVDKMEEKGWTGFLSDEKGLFIFEYMIKGFLKHSGNVLKESLKVKALRSKLDDFMFVSPRRIYMEQLKPDGFIERPIRVKTALGPRVSLIRSDFIKPGKIIEFEIALLSHKELTWDLIDKLMMYGELAGLGQFRNGGYGRFSFKVIM